MTEDREGKKNSPRHPIREFREKYFAEEAAAAAEQRYYSPASPISAAAAAAAVATVGAENRAIPAPQSGSAPTTPFKREPEEESAQTFQLYGDYHSLYPEFAPNNFQLPLSPEPLPPGTHDQMGNSLSKIQRDAVIPPAAATASVPDVAIHINDDGAEADDEGGSGGSWEELPPYSYFATNPPPAKMWSVSPSTFGGVARKLATLISSENETGVRQPEKHDIITNQTFHHSAITSPLHHVASRDTVTHQTQAHVPVTSTTNSTATSLSSSNSRAPSPSYGNPLYHAAVASEILPNRFSPISSASGEFTKLEIVTPPSPVPSAVGTSEYSINISDF